jgi:hypothetical protein
MSKNKKMKNNLMLRIKKWMIFILIGCLAYLIGYVWGHSVQKSPTPIELENSEQQN